MNHSSEIIKIPAEEVAEIVGGKQMLEKQMRRAGVIRGYDFNPTGTPYDGEARLVARFINGACLFYFRKEGETYFYTTQEDLEKYVDISLSNSANPKQSFLDRTWPATPKAPFSSRYDRELMILRQHRKEGTIYKPDRKQTILNSAEAAELFGGKDKLEEHLVSLGLKRGSASVYPMLIGAFCEGSAFISYKRSPSGGTFQFFGGKKIWQNLLATIYSANCRPERFKPVRPISARVSRG